VASGLTTLKSVFVMRLNVPGPHLIAFFTSAPIFTSSVAVNSFSAKATGHMAPSSRFAVSLKLQRLG
jgi:hypothetical protein